MDHDALFKELLRTFFAEFMQLFFQDVADLLDLTLIEFPNKDLFSDLTDGIQRKPDVIAQIRTKDGQPEIVLVHTEVEGQRRSTFRARMFEYYALLRWRFKLPVFPIVVYLSPGAGGLVTERYIERLFDRDVNVFSYSAVGLPDLQSDEYLTKDNVLAPALSALMKTSSLGRVAQKYQSLLALARSGIGPARLALLSNVVESYLKLDEREQARFAELVTGPDGNEVKQMVSVYEERGIEIGIVRGKRETLLRQINLKFGPLSEEVRTRVERITDGEVLDRLIDRIMTANTIDEMRLPVT